jgi:hypothetical protein
MTSFSRFFNADGVLVNKSMNDMENLIKSEANRKEIAELIFHRLYDRFLKIFFYEANDYKSYKYGEEKKNLSSFKTEYKNGFLMMTSACLLIETISAFLQGNNHTVGFGNDNFNFFFKKCFTYGNELKIFENKRIYKNVRNGLLHQGETYSKFKITREGLLYKEDENKINASEFINHLNRFLESYNEELIDSSKSSWDGTSWDNSRVN